MPHGASEAPSRSAVVATRAGLKLIVFIVSAAAQHAAGRSFGDVLALLVTLSAFMMAALGVLRREQPTAPYCTSFDEAAWFLLIAAALRRLA